MSARSHMLVELLKEVLGPRNGPYESMPDTENPRDEYITGVLAPATAPRAEEDIDADVDEVVEEVYGEEDETPDDGAAGSTAPSESLAPALDPRALPRSIGLSFTAEADEEPPAVRVCFTWARYRQEEGGWKRHPASWLADDVSVDQDRVWSAAQGVSAHLSSRRVSRGRWRVSLFLVNTSEVEKGERPSVEDHLFQPQIRLCCQPGTTLVPMTGDDTAVDPEPGSMESEDASLSMLYEERAAIARGHLCGVTWKAIDPERPHPTLESPGEAPFGWTDDVTVDEAAKRTFSPPDVRTEMVPCYPVEAPQMGWDDGYGPTPILDPELLAETWRPERVRDALRPLLEGYLTWIRGQQSLAGGLPVEQQTVGTAHIQQCRQAAGRIEQAIDILANDRDARLAFCFANKAIALQSRWTRGQVFEWRPFQLAFILLNVPALVDPLNPDRSTCDLLWFPTGGGKTEAYLGLAAFTLALRRRRAAQDGREEHTGDGVGVLSRYTLRLLTIQQFRRALGVVTACEALRVDSLDDPEGAVGWRPRECEDPETFLWGGTRFSTGLWVGSNVTPNGLLSTGPIPGPGGMTFFVGALDRLRGAGRNYAGPDQRLRGNLRSANVVADGDPAQVLRCPCCDAMLAVPEGEPDRGLGAGSYTLQLAMRDNRVRGAPPPPVTPAHPGVGVDSADIIPHEAAGYSTLSLGFTVAEGANLTARQVDEWWYRGIGPTLGDVELLAARPARPGYFLLTYLNMQNNPRPCDFAIYCPDPACELNAHAWAEQVPIARTGASAPPRGNGGLSVSVRATEDTAALPAATSSVWQETPSWCRRGRTQWISNRIPIPALTVDDQVYHRCPSLVIATVDKFARLAFEPKAASLFGHVTHYHSRWGFYREGAPPSWESLPTQPQPHPPGRSRGNPLHVAVTPFAPPDLILQDELHLIEGPLGSMVGLYEAAVDLLCRRGSDGNVVAPKYIASTATVRQAESQVRALFDRRLAQFPPWSIRADDRFFARERETHPLEDDRPGRLYVAVCAPGKGAQTPIVRIWAALLQRAYERWSNDPGPEADRFWTLAGYFNAIRELAGALSLYRQDIPERVDFRFGPGGVRDLDDDRRLELSSRVNSLELPGLLDRLADEAPDAPDAAFATSMFGTGVDVARLGLMVVHGQPKTTASYIQATGRVGRSGGGLVVGFFRASRPRDLDHYEFFTGYHRALYRHVEPVTVSPFSSRARDQALGPLALIMLRHAEEIDGHAVASDWRVQQRLSSGYFSQARRMGTNRHDPEVTAIPNLLETRGSQQPDGRQPPGGAVSRETASELDLWAALARQNPSSDLFVYYEPSVFRAPTRDVVLGDAHHRTRGLSEAFENAPQSLREVEETTGFKS